MNEKVVEGSSVSWTEIPYSEAKQRKDIQQFFGDKYGVTVRVVQIGGERERLDGYSMELCGGTHVRSTGDIQWFHIVREEAIAAGIRRIEALAGDAVRDWAQQEAWRQDEKFDAFQRKKSDLSPLPEFVSTGEISDLVQQIEKRAAHLATLDDQVRAWLIPATGILMFHTVLPE